MIELRGYDRDRMAHKAENIYNVALYRSLPIPELDSPTSNVQKNRLWMFQREVGLETKKKKKKDHTAVGLTSHPWWYSQPYKNYLTTGTIFITLCTH